MVSEQDFDELLTEALEELPLWVQEIIERENIVICGREKASPGVLDKDSNRILGLFRGVPYGSRSREPLPPRIEIYRQPMLENYGPDNLKEKIKKTLIHEIGHFLGMSEEEVRRRGF
ncbi:MAG: metallopeptidase family protein [bacterium]